MKRYRISVNGSVFDFEGENSKEARATAAALHPGAQIGPAFFVDPMPEVPRKRSGNSRYHLADVDKMGADGAAPLGPVRPRGTGRRRGRR